MLLGVNIDHIAVLREARKVADPDPLDALSICKRAGADQITIHLREDRRHMRDSDAQNIISLSALPVNLECAMSQEMIEIASTLRPHRVTLVPEKREEVTTEGGLDLIQNRERLQEVIATLQAKEIEVSLFIDPTEEMVECAMELNVEWVEFHTGHYANLYAMLYTNLSKTHHSITSLPTSRKALKEALDISLFNLKSLALKAYNGNLRIAAGHGLTMHNVDAIVAIKEIEELNIGQSIIARSIFVGLEQAIIDMRTKVQR